MDIQAIEGVRIGKRNSGFNLGYYGTYAYWLIEIGIVALVVGGFCAVQASEPFCAGCNRWKKARVVGPFPGNPDEAKDAIESGEVGKLGRRGVSPTVSSLQLSVSVCPDCRNEGPVDVRLQELKTTKDGTSTHDLCHVTYPGEALVAIKAVADRDEDDD